MIRRLIFFVFIASFWTKILVSGYCSYELVETIPDDLTYSTNITTKPTYEELLKLINSANSSIDIASYYWTLRGEDVMPNPVPESVKGTNILNALIDAGKSRSVKVRIAVNGDYNADKSEDLKLLKKYAEIRKVNFTRLIGAGILHTKFLIVDNERYYLGSANMDWRSLTHVKEMGIVANCSQLAEDLRKIFDVYWFLGESNASIPKVWPPNYSAFFNKTRPFKSIVKSEVYDIYLTSSPKELCANNRINDINAIIDIINDAEKFIDIAVMDYYPTFLYKSPIKFWPIIDDALRRAAIERNVQVRLLASKWNNTRQSMHLFLKSLSALNNTGILKGSIETKQFIVPVNTPAERDIPFARVNHNKYMVTDKTAYIGTSNWSADYFVNTGGVGLVINVASNSSSTNLRSKLQTIFERDWFSQYTKAV